MEVMGSVLVGDGDVVNTQIKGGFADLGRKLESHEKDDVPRLLLKGFQSYTNPFTIHLEFSKFGTITYLAVKNQKAVLEFSSREALHEIEECNILKIHGAKIKTKRLRKFLHVEKNQFQVDLHHELMQLDSEKAFDEFVEQLCKQSTECCSNDWKTVCKVIEKYARRAYPKCEVYPFGSRITQLGLEGCDLDIFLDCGDMYYGSYDCAKEQMILGETVQKELLRCVDFPRIYKVLHARVPILKFFYRPTSLHGDIAFRNGLGVENSKLLIFLQTLDSRVRPFLLFVKMWSCLQNLHVVAENKHFSSYSLVMMAVFYLQQLTRPVLPPICKLMDRYRGECTVIAGWPCSFSDIKVIPKVQNNSSVLELTKGFFQFYKFFNFEKRIICPYLGEAIERRDLDELSTSFGGRLSSVFPTYVENLQEGSECFVTQVPICVQDPFEHSHNLTRCVKEDIVMKFISSCGLMLEQLCTIF